MRNVIVLFCRCLIKDFEERPSVTHLLEHPFIRQAHGKDMELQKQLADLIQAQQQLGSVAKTRYCTISSNLSQFQKLKTFNYKSFIAYTSDII